MKSIFTTSDCLSLQQLQDYQNGRLSKAALRRVEEHLIDCALCDGALAGLEQSQNLHQDTKQIQSLRFGNKKAFRLSRIAAVLAIGFALLVAFWFRPQLSPEYLFASFYVIPQPTDIQLRDTPQDAASKDIELALSAYQKGDFPSAITLLKQYQAAFPDDNQVYLWLGIAQLETGNEYKAIQLFHELRSKDLDYYEKGSWYLILAYLKKGETKLAEEVAKELQGSEGRAFQEKLPQLLKKIKRLPK